MSNIKIVIGALVLTSICFGSVGAQSSTVSNNGYQTPVIDSTFEFNAKRDGHMIYMDWDTYDNDDFKYYKILKAKDDENLFYPERSAIKYFSNADHTELKISNYNQDSEYYRVCVITQDKARLCSELVKLEGYEKVDGQHDTDQYSMKKEEYKAKLNAKKDDRKHKISQKIEQKANNAIKNYIKKVENKFEDTQDRIDILTKIADKLNNLAVKNTKYAGIVEVMVEKINEKIESYNDDFSEIDDILNDF